MPLTGKTALVTGAARGIGRGCAIELARAGADIVLNDRDRTPEAETTLRDVVTLGRRATLIEGDCFTRTGCESIVSRTLDAFGRIDILVSNPAFSRRGDFLDYDPEMFDRTIQGTLVGGFHMSQLVARAMVERGTRGAIVFISSVHAGIPYVRSVAYNAAKAGLNHMAQTIAAELAKHRIRVNVIEPGWIDTPGEHETFGHDAIRQAAPNLPWGRLGTPEDIGRAAAFLASEAAGYITGTILRVDGGFVLRAAGI